MQNLDRDISDKTTLKKILKMFFKSLWVILKSLFIIIIAAGVACGMFITGVVYGYMKTTEPITEEQVQITTGLTSYFYDNNDEVIMELTGIENKNRIVISYDDIPRDLENAIIAIEDKRFYKHIGIDIQRITKSILSVIKNMGTPSGGGSTITQQVVKHITDNWDISFERKVQEWYNAVMLEKRYDKKDILTLYLNVINMGNGCYGVQAASQLYFGKDVSDLTLAESAAIAAIPNSPVQYDPYRTYTTSFFKKTGIEYLKNRQEIILDLMLEQGYITNEEYEEAVNTELVFKEKEIKNQNIVPTTYFIDQVIEEVIADLMYEKNISRDTAAEWIYNKGYKIYTTLDSDIQDAMDSVFLDSSFFPVTDENGNTLNQNAEKYGEIPQAGMVIIDQATGYVKAIYGGNGEKTGSRIYNRATQAQRQPGSSFKPIAVYAPAIDLELITASTVIDDVPVYLDDKNPEQIYPKNYESNIFNGLTTIRNAVKASVNVVAARVWKEYLGRDNCVEYLKKVGINRSNEIYDDSTVSVAMGGLETGVSPLEMASSYCALANDGVYIEPATYTRVTNSEGDVILENTQEVSIAYSEQTAFIMTDILREVTLPQNTPYPSNGTAYRRINIQDRQMPVAGKTGTTSDNLDKWFVGYTPYYTAAVWYGYDNKIKPIKLVSSEWGQAQEIWNAVMEKVHENLSSKSFGTVPSGIVIRDVCIYSGQFPTDLCHHDPRGDAVISEYYIKGTEPKYYDACEVHVEAKVCTSSRDVFGRWFLADASCPYSSIIEKILLIRPDPYMLKDPKAPSVQDMIYELLTGEYCPVHGNYSYYTYMSDYPDEDIITGD